VCVFSVISVFFREILTAVLENDTSFCDLMTYHASFSCLLC